MKLTKLVSTTLPAAFILCSASAMASSSIDGLKVAVIKNAIGSSHLVAGDYEQVLSEEMVKTSGSDEFSTTMSLCAAHIKTYKLEAAERSCSDAIAYIPANASRGRHGKLLKGLAYSNRGIARYLNKNYEEAFEDFAKAKSISNSKIIANNISYFESAMMKTTTATETPTEIAD